jgi:hypothetical protein
MKEIQEREHAYMMGDGAYCWRNGELQSAEPYKGPWAKSMFHDKFIAGEIFPLDPLTSEFVCAPKPERPFDMTSGQVFDALEQDKSARFENRHGHVAFCEVDVQAIETDLDEPVPFSEYNKHSDGWRKVESDE